MWNSRLERTLDKRSVEGLKTMNPLEAVYAAVDTYDTELATLNEEPSCDVVIVCRPDDLPEQAPPVQNPDKPWEAPRREYVGVDSYSPLKARSPRTSRPIHIIRRQTWDKSFKPKDDSQNRPQQDEATKAWNLHTALYYEAGGVPWRMIRPSEDLTSCDVGVAFYRAADEETLQTSVAQVFNERGDGVIVRGAQAAQSKDDRQPHLTGEDARTCWSSH